MRKLGQNAVDRVFDEHLSNAEMTVSNKVWDNISSELEKDGLRRKIYWYRSVAAASVVLLIGLGTWMLSGQFVTSGENAASFASGKPLKERTHDFALAKDIITPTPAAVASSRGNAQSTPSSLALFGQDHINWGKSSQQKRAVVSIQWISQPAASTFVSTENRTHEGLLSRKPSLLPRSGSDTQRRPANFMDGQALAFAESSPGKAPKQRKEKEFAYVIDDLPHDKAPMKHWELGAGFAPDMTFSSTTPVEQDHARSTQILADDPTAANTERLSPVVAYTSGLRASYDISQRLSVRSGVTYLNRQTSTTEAVNNFGKMDAYQSTLNLSTLEIPVSMKYNFIAKKHFDCYVATGVSGNFLLHYDNAQVSSSGKISARHVSAQTDIMKPSQANLLLSSGVKYRILDRLNLQLEPGMRYGFANNEYSFSQSRPVSLSLLTGLHFQF